MRIGIDSRPLREPQTSGIPMYVRSLLNELAKIDRDNEYVLYAHKDFDFPLPGPNFQKRSGAWTRYGSVWMQAELPRWLDRDGIDVFWGTQHILPLAMSRRVKAVLTVHDLVHYVFPKTMRVMNYLINKFVIPPSIHRTDAIVAISQWTLSDVKRFLDPKNKIMEVNHLGVAPHFFPRDRKGAQETVRKQFGVQGPYLLTVGTFEPRKNVVGTFRAFSRLADQVPHSLVVVGQKGWKNERVLDEMERSRIRHRIHMVGYVPDQLLPDIYSGADVFIFPSLYEGFGLPPLEAMACGVPVVSSNVSSIPEIVGDAASLANPQDPEDIANKILQILTDPSLRFRQVGRGIERSAQFTWASTARRMKDLFDRVHNGRRP